MDRSHVTAARHELLALHKTLIEAARIDLERIEGRLTGNEMLDRLLTDERLAWLRPLTALIVGMDELLESDEPGDADTNTNYLARAVALLTPDDGEGQGDLFAIEYRRFLHDRPEVTMAHAAVMRVLTYSAGRTRSTP